MRVKIAVLAAATLVTAAGVGVGVILHSPDEPAPTRPSTTTLAQVDTTTIVVAREPFCDRLTNADVKAALAGEPTRTASYGDGDSATLTGAEGSVTDVAQEYGCTWTGPSTAGTTTAGATARAWVFAPPVTLAWARQMSARAPKGCHAQQGPAYGRPTLAFTCTSQRRSTVSYRGLFGDAWLSCELTGRPGEAASEITERAGRWCLAVARAATA